ncbi:isocitrate lyase/PEP mutase family protein [Rhodococcoides fascians A25f]|uniref:isocitrate lyase/PEP mutase family protein n=1 Tax=Rhodococcoides fascians TaxID=1828 RepID=UPI000569B70A|nr:isocitrate lyase/PEP mutase family protein [Rhodococcus fascians]QII07174.1 isocitrate lyase/PEP mutase family protein [Rhodococcus fascians A25f]
MHAADTLRTLISPGAPIVRAPGAFDSFSARLVESAGFPAVYMTGFGATASRLGMPDIGLLTQTEMTEHARNMVRSTSIPVIADADTGYGGPSNIDRTVQEYIQAGVASIHLEDQIAPKRCGQMAGIRLMPMEESTRRVQAAVAARKEGSLLVIARTDALAATGHEDAIARAERYRDAGADLVFVDGVKTRYDVDYVAENLAGPKVVSLVDGTEAATLSASDLEERGFSIVFYALTALFSAATAMRKSLFDLHETGVIAAGNDAITYSEYSDIVGLPYHQKLDNEFGAL